MKKNLMILLIAAYCLVSNVNSASDSKSNDEDRTTKAKSCLKLLQVRISDDKDFLEESLHAFVPKYRENKFDEVFLKLKNNLLVSCFSEISLLKAADIVNSQINKINPYTKDHKHLFDSTAFTERFQDDTNRYEKNLKLFESYLGAFKEEVNKIDELVATGIDSLISFPKKKDSEYISKSKDSRTRQNEKAYESKDNQENLDEGAYSNLNLNLFGYNLNSPFIKNTLGFSLLGLILLGLYWAYITVTKDQNKEVPKKKKKRNQEKEE